MFLSTIFCLVLAIIVNFQIKVVSFVVVTFKRVVNGLCFFPRTVYFLITDRLGWNDTNDPQFSFKRRLRRGVIAVCRLPLADRFRPRTTPYIGIYNACLVERVLTESMVSFLRDYQKRYGPRLKLYICFRGSKSISDLVCDWLTRLPNYSVYRQQHWPINADSLARHFGRIDDKFAELMPRFHANSMSHAGDIQQIMPFGGGEDEEQLRPSSRPAHPINSVVRRGPSSEYGQHMIFLPHSGQTQNDMLESSLRRAFEDGCEEVIFVNTHAPGLSNEHLSAAFRAIAEGAEIVLGRCSRGGCYLVGAAARAFKNQPGRLSGIFNYVLWGTRNVYSLMIGNATARQRQLNVASLRLMLDEVDSFEVLNLLERHVGLPLELMAHAGISVLMPVLNEEDVAVNGVRTLVQNYSGKHGHLEVVVVDGRSTDYTLRQLEELRDSLGNSCQVDLQIHCLPDDRERSWESQLHFAVSKASHAYYVFIHADTRLGPNWDDVVVRSLNRPGIVAGVFPFMASLPNDYVWLWLMSWGLYGHLLNFLRWSSARWCGHCVGEQGLFMHAFFFRLMGGIRGLHLGSLPGGLGSSRRCLRHGGVAICGDPVAVLPRRWMRRSLLKGLCVEALMVAAEAVGVTPSLCHALYAKCPRLNREMSPSECG